MNATNPYPIPVYLAITHPRVDEPHMAEYHVGYWDVETGTEVDEPIEAVDFYATLSAHHEHVIYAEGGDYYAFDFIEVQRDACERYTRARAQAWALAPEMAYELDAEIDAMLAGTR